MIIRKLKEQDLEARVRLLNLPSLADKLNTNEVFNITKTKQWFQEAQRDPKRYDVVFIVGGVIVGMAGLVNISKKDSNSELYIFIDPEAQGKGYGKKGLSALIDIAFKSFNLNKIYLYTFATNIKANLFYEKMYFKLEGCLRSHTSHNGEFKDRNIYGLLRSEWL